MPRKKVEKGRNANGNGTIRKKTVIKNGKEYTYWEARYTEGYDPGTGKQIQRSITGKTQKEVAQRLKAATAAIDAGTYTAIALCNTPWTILIDFGDNPGLLSVPSPRLL